MSTWQRTAKTLVRRLIAERTLVLVVATAVLVVIGVIATIADEYDLSLLCILALQATIVGYLLTSPGEEAGTSGVGTVDELRAAVDRSSARTLTDLAHARQSILDAIAELEAKGK
ncbi:hypothetical protein [Aeromicrobium fastidiosum]|uniref:Uncharacterized protein n=1 Tax=Aeromicrobium fastidiosum TaxID=52699 RepID=A0A641AJM8_9ACTN|nr:hypothetical protein [Aeromicrobium fastidiosum]KAA1374918.1 hypothetical protein ESP62_016235 [Aeromicrobium fastidiosum]MBP2390510.1 hypothetical protein [Aeromicrobium fastidiosum]